MQDPWVQRNPCAWLTFPVPPEKLPLQMLCFLYCSPHTTDEKLVAHCASFVNQEEFSLEYLMKVLKKELFSFSISLEFRMSYFPIWWKSSQHNYLSQKNKRYWIKNCHTDIDVWFQAVQGKFSYLLIIFINNLIIFSSCILGHTC